jgi:citrate synthase
MGVSSIDEVLEKVKDEKLKKLLSESKAHHEKLEEDIEHLLEQMGAEEKNPNPMAKGMSWMKTNMKMGWDESDATVADLLTDGCDMGIKSLYRYLNQYKDAEQEATSIAKRLIDIEAKLETELRKYL